MECVYKYNEVDCVLYSEQYKQPTGCNNLGYCERPLVCTDFEVNPFAVEDKIENHRCC